MVRRGKRIRALATWHWGRGPEYCRDCRALGEPCATTERWRCRYLELAPRAAAGAAVWGLVNACGQVLRFGVWGQVMGLDWDRLFLVAGELGVPREALIRLLPALEAGLLAGVHGDDQEDDLVTAGGLDMPAVTPRADHGG